jgi:hypothetical protein
MAADAIRTAIRAASEYLAQHPEQARSTDSAATATLVEGLVVRVTGPKGAIITTDSDSDDRGLLGLDDDVPAGPLSGRVGVRLAAAGVDSATLEEIAQWGVKHCPVCDALERPVPVTTEVSTA